MGQPIFRPHTLALHVAVVISCIHSAGRLSLAMTVDQSRITGLNSKQISDMTCGAEIPKGKSIFSNFDPQTTVWFHTMNADVGDKITYTWRYPNGSVQSTGPWGKQPDSSGEWCFWAWLDIPGKTPFSAPGTWSVTVRLNATELFTRQFVITALGTPINTTWHIAPGDSSRPPSSRELSQSLVGLSTALLPEVNTFDTAENGPAKSRLYLADVTLPTAANPLFLYFSSDDGAEVYVNGIRVTSYSSEPGGDLSQLRECVNNNDCQNNVRAGPVQLPSSVLQASGTNRIAIKVTNVSGASFFSAALATMLPRRQLIMNGGFENGLHSWDIPTWGANPPAIVSLENPRRGTRAVCLGTPLQSGESSGDSAIFQRIALPADAPTILLTFSYLPWSADVSLDYDGQQVLLYDADGNKHTLFATLESDNVWKRKTLDVSEFRGQQISILFDVYEDGAGDPTGMCIDDVSVINGAEPVFVVHGIAQQGGDGGDMQHFAETLRNPVYGLMPVGHFMVDAGFKYACANDTFCKDTCTIGGGGDQFASYIEHTPDALGDVSVIGYSLGGLMARQGLVAHPEIFATRTIDRFVTLGTPHLGYAYRFEDRAKRCTELAKEMFGDFLADSNDSSLISTRLQFADGQTMFLSPVLTELFAKWQRPVFQGKPRAWYTIAGTFCNDTYRTGSLGGCPYNTSNDGVVCEASASMRVAADYEPTDRKAFNWMAHTSPQVGTWFLYCSTPDGTQPLFDPARSGDVVSWLQWWFTN